MFDNSVLRGERGDKNFTSRAKPDPPIVSTHCRSEHLPTHGKQLTADG